MLTTSDEQDEYLERLAGELGKRQFSARLVSRGSAHHLVVANPDYPDLNERIMPDLEAEGGCGLFLVVALSTRWSWFATQEPVGKVTWCELDIVQLESPPGIDGSALQSRLPRRIPGVVRARPAAAINDPDILRRLRDGLHNLGPS